MTLKVGCKVYVDNGEDDFQGGLATVATIKEQPNGTMFTIHERPGWNLNWGRLQSRQRLLRKAFKGQVAHHSDDVMAFDLM